MGPDREQRSETGALDGDWRVERTGGLPPMVGVRKRIGADRWEARLGPLLRLPIRV